MGLSRFIVWTKNKSDLAKVHNECAIFFLTYVIDIVKNVVILEDTIDVIYFTFLISIFYNKKRSFLIFKLGVLAVRNLEFS